MAIYSHNYYKYVLVCAVKMYWWLEKLVHIRLCGIRGLIWVFAGRIYHKVHSLNIYKDLDVISDVTYDRTALHSDKYYMQILDIKFFYW